MWKKVIVNDRMQRGFQRFRLERVADVAVQTCREPGRCHAVTFRPHRQAVMPCLARSACAAIVACTIGCASPPNAPPAVTYADDYTLFGARNFLTGYDTKNADGTFNMAVEIPTGTSQKWETCTTASLADTRRFPGCTAAGREMVVEAEDGERRVIHHLGYPGNYGSMPRTRAGDGDPLDIIAIGAAAERGTVIPVKVIGVIRCLDGAVRDDKIVAVASNSPLHARVSSAADLEMVAPKAADILLAWYQNYKGAGAMTCTALDDEIAAMGVIVEAQTAYDPLSQTAR
jgi:inorganic pyrophosphatase